MSQAKEYGIVIKLNPCSAAEAERLHLECTGKLPDLQNPPNIWHVSLYHLACDEKNLGELAGKLKELKNTNISLNFLEITNTEDRWIDWRVEKTSALYELHKQVVHLASPYHKGKLKRVQDVFETLGRNKKEQAEQFGVHGVLDLYNPHTSIFYQYPPDGRLEEAAKNLSSIPRMSELAETLLIGELGFNGNIIREVAEFDISLHI